MTVRSLKQRIEGRSYLMPKLKTIMVECKGISPIIMDRPDPNLLMALHFKTKQASPRDKTPEQVAQEKVYTDGDTRPGIPVENLLACLVEAGRSVKYAGKKMVSTVGSTFLYAFMAVKETFLHFSDVEGLPPTYKVDVRRGVNPNGGEMVCLIRPRYDAWSFVVTIEVDTEQVTEAVARELFEIAGRAIGLGSFRPSKRGPFGRFKVIEWEEMES